MMLLDRLKQDLRYGFRQLAANKGFALIAILTLALGIGANTAVFTLIHAILLKPLPVAHAAELYRLGGEDSCCTIGGYQGGHFSIFSDPLYEYLRDHTPEFSELAAFEAGLGPLSVARAGESAPPLSFNGEFVSGNYFSTLGVNAYSGRTITPADDAPNAAPVAVISFRAWQQYYGSDPSIPGTHISIDGVPFTIAGVAPSGFFGETLRANPPDFWIPLATEPAVKGENSVLTHADEHWLYILGRIRPGMRPEAVEAKVNVELKQWFTNQAGSHLTQKDRTEIAQQHIVVTPASGGVGLMKIDYEDSLRILTAISALVLLIACANIANLLLARAAANRIAISIRVALGAARSRLMRQTITEAVLLALLGGAAGIFVAYAGTRAILLLAFRGVQYVPLEASPALPVLAFALVLSFLTGFAFGVVPAWIASRSDPSDALRGASRSTARHSTLPQKSLVVLQAALSCVLLCGAGLLGESLRNLEHQPFGFQTQNRLILRVNPAFTGYTPDHLAAVYRQLQEKLEQIPGVTSASFSLYSPMEGQNWSGGISIEGRHQEYSASWDRVSAHYLETIGTRLIRGRLIGDQDTPNSRHVAVVNQTFANKFFPNENPIGKHFGHGDISHSLDYEIVGIVEDAKYLRAREPAWPTYFIPFLQMSPQDWSDPALTRSNYIHDIQLRVTANHSNPEQLIRQAIAQVDRNITVVRVHTFADQVSLNFNRERLIARLTELFGLLALILASVGLYGLTAYSVARRTNEIGIRVAVGADRGQVTRMVLRGAFAQIVLGLLIGIPVSLGAARLLSHQLYGVRGYDPVILGTVVALLGACAAIACALPAHRAASIDPIVALRDS